MSGFDFNIALTVFYLFVRFTLYRSLVLMVKWYAQYSVVEIPSNLVLKRFGSVWLAVLVTSFGAVAIGTAFIKSYAGLIVTRVFLGLAEGGTLVCTS